MRKQAFGHAPIADLGLMRRARSHQPQVFFSRLELQNMRCHFVACSSSLVGDRPYSSLPLSKTAEAGARFGDSEPATRSIAAPCPHHSKRSNCLGSRSPAVGL